MTVSISCEYPCLSIKIYFQQPTVQRLSSMRSLSHDKKSVKKHSQFLQKTLGSKSLQTATFWKHIELKCSQVGGMSWFKASIKQTCNSRSANNTNVVPYIWILYRPPETAISISQTKNLWEWEEWDLVVGRWFKSWWPGSKDYSHFGNDAALDINSH